jgi:hypothetical protein
MAKPTEAPNRAAFLNEFNAHVKDTERYLDGLRTAQEIVASTMLTTSNVRPHRAPKRKRAGISHGSRTQMLQTILDHAPRPVTVVEIEAEMAQQGRNDPRRLIYSTLSYLARKGTAKTSERGKWVSVTGVNQQQAA